MDYMIVSTLRGLCIKNNWFTEGTESQYGKMFSLAKNLFKTADREQTVHRLSDIIWLCSEDADVTDIHKELYAWWDKLKESDSGCR